MATNVQSGTKSTTVHHGKPTDLWRKGEPQEVRDLNDEYQAGRK